MRRLDDSEMARLPAAVQRPGYERQALRPGIVHLGLGAFARAHLVQLTEAVLQAGDLRWGVVGVSLRQPDTRDALVPQDGLYTVAVRDVDASGAPRQALQVVGALCACRLAPQAPQQVLRDIAHPEARILSLTVTEKGYLRDLRTGALMAQHPELMHDASPAGAWAPRSALGFIVHGLSLRRAAGLPGLSLLSLDNLPSNGDTLRALVLDLAQRVQPPLADWIDTHCSFPNSMVDRIVPRTTAADRAQVAAALGWEDAWPVVAEPFLAWAVEDRFVAGRPDWAGHGVRLVERAQPWEQLKLRMVNGSHSAIAYLGAMAGWATVDQAMAQPALRRYVQALLREEIEPTLPTLTGLDLEDYRARLLQRFANPALAHRTLQIAMDGSQKLPQRLLAPLRERLSRRQGIERLAMAVAAWLHFLRAADEQGRPLPVEDPLADALLELRAQAAQRTTVQEEAAALLGFAPVFGDLATEPRAVDAVARALAALRAHGVLSTLQAWA